LQKSSDIGVSHIALAHARQALVDTYQAFGLGKPTGLGLSGESVGYFRCIASSGPILNERPSHSATGYA
jgi:cell division protein FtsI/penicillin-binding protein 2